MEFRDWLLEPVMTEFQRLEESQRRERREEWARFEALLTRLGVLMAVTDRVQVATEQLTAYNIAVTGGVNALLTSNANLQKALDDLKANAAVDDTALDALDKAVADAGLVADHFKVVVDPAQPAPTTTPDVAPVADAPPITPVPVPTPDQVPAIPAPGGEATNPDGTPAAGTPAPDASASAGPGVPTDASGAPRTGDGSSAVIPGTVDNTDGFLGTVGASGADTSGGVTAPVAVDPSAAPVEASTLPADTTVVEVPADVATPVVVPVDATPVAVTEVAPDATVVPVTVGPVDVTPTDASAAPVAAGDLPADTNVVEVPAATDTSAPAEVPADATPVTAGSLDASATVTPVDIAASADVSATPVPVPADGPDPAVPTSDTGSTPA